MKTQAVYSLLDLILFSNKEKLKVSTTSILENLQNHHTHVPYTPHTHWHTRFGHLVWIFFIYL